MYEYVRKRHIPASASGVLGADSYTPPRPDSRVAPWAIAKTTVQNIDVKCYQDAPREQVLREMAPYTMEISVLGHNFVCIGNPDQECPESVHRNTDPKDPWRQRQCAAWKQSWEQQAADIIASQEFRNQVTENILNVAGISSWRRWFTKPAEFIQVLSEKESRERAIKIASVLALAIGGGAILWVYLKNKNENKFQENRIERNFPFGTVGGLVALGTGTVAAAVATGIAVKRANERREHVGIYVIGRRASGEPVESEFRLAANSLGGLINATVYGASTGRAILEALNRHEHIERLVLFGHGAPQSFMLPGVSGIRVGASQLPAWISVEDFAAAIGPKLRAGAIIGLAGCAAGANPGQERDWNTAYSPGGENSFAAQLRDALSRIPGIQQGIEVRAHTRTGHTTANPSAIVFRVGRGYIGTPGSPVIDEKWGSGTNADTANQQHFAGEFRAGAQQRRSPADKWMVGEDWWSTLTLPPNPVWTQSTPA